VKEKYEDLYQTEDAKEDNPKVERTWQSLSNWFKKKIQQGVFNFNPFYKRIADCPPSGVPKDEWLVVAVTSYDGVAIDLLDDEDRTRQRTDSPRIDVWGRSKTDTYFTALV
jgi:hypothetical protein